MEDSTKIQTVVEGEASESDEDEEVRQISENAQAAAPELPEPVRRGFVVEGEASESDEEIDTRIVVAPLMVNKDGAGDISRDLLREDSVTSSSDQPVDKPKYNTLLHRKLRERHNMFRRHLVDSSAQIYLSASKDLHNTTQQLMKTQQVVQDISHKMRLLTNDLFHLEDRIDIICTCNLLPDINIEVPSLASAKLW